MQINCTLFIQVINLAITYYFVDRLLLRSSVHSLAEKKAQFDAVLATVSQTEQELRALEHLKKEHVSAFQKKIREKYPFISLLRYDKVAGVISSQKISIDEQKLTQETVNWIVKKVPHAY
jgi:hypothetical protein